MTGRRFGFLVGLEISLALSFARLASAELRVWTVTETRHVLRGEAAGSQTTVQISAGRNEWVSFQILLRSDAVVNGISLEAGDLKGAEGFVLRGSNARLYRQHQLRLEIGTYRNDGFKPDCRNGAEPFATQNRLSKCW